MKPRHSARRSSGRARSSRYGSAAGRSPRPCSTATTAWSLRGAGDHQVPTAHAPGRDSRQRGELDHRAPAPPAEPEPGGTHHLIGKRYLKEKAQGKRRDGKTTAERLVAGE